MNLLCTFPNGLGTTFDYKITVVGNYSYKCSFHNGMIGSFEAIDNTEGIIQEKEINTLLKASPNPFKGKISIPNKTANWIERGRGTRGGDDCGRDGRYLHR